MTGSVGGLFFLVENEPRVSTEAAGVLEQIEEVVVALVVLEEVARQHEVACGHGALVAFVNLALGGHRGPRDRMRVVEEPDHPVNEAIGAGHLSIGSVHLRLAALRAVLEMLVHGCRDEIGRLHREEHAAREDRVDEATSVADHGVVRGVMVRHLVRVVPAHQDGQGLTCALEEGSHERREAQLVQQFRRFLEGQGSVRLSVTKP